MKVLWLVPSDMVIEWLVGSFHSFDHNNTDVIHFYDKHGSPSDGPILDAVDRIRPDVVLFVGQAGGPWLAFPDTFLRIRSKTKIVHICLDAADLGYEELLTLYKRLGCFDLTVACDGPAYNPETADIVLFHPVDPRPYAIQKPIRERPIPLGTCGGFPYGLRRDVMSRLSNRCNLFIKPREETWGSYVRYARFYTNCRIVVDCALSAGGHAGTGPFTRTLKTRAIEVGLAGACLVELRACALNRYADEGTDYATYETPEEAEGVVKELLNDPRRVEVLAENLQKVIHNKMSPGIFYSVIWERLGLVF